MTWDKKILYFLETLFLEIEKSEIIVLTAPSLPSAQQQGVSGNAGKREGKNLWS